MNRFRNIRPGPLLSQLIITMIYPVAKAAASESKRLLIFTDSLTIIAAALLIAGIVYSLVLHGDYDIAAFILRRSQKNEKQSFDAYLEDRKREREDAFNYPLFLAMLYFIIALILAYTVL